MPLVTLNFVQRSTNKPAIFAHQYGSELLGYTSSVRRNSIGNHIAGLRGEIAAEIGGVTNGVGHILLTTVPA